MARMEFSVLSGKEATGIPVLDVFAWGRWPHFLTWLMFKYNVPHSFCIATLFLMDGTLGRNSDADGYIPVSQIPVRNPELRKYLAAYCKAGLFTKFDADYKRQIAANYEYEKNTTPEQWERFFDAIAKVCELGGLADSYSPEQFARVVASAARDSKPAADDGGPKVPVDESTKEQIQEIQRRLEAMARRKPK